MSKIGPSCKPQLLATALSLVMALGFQSQSVDLLSSLPDNSALSFTRNAFADHGREIILSLNDSSLVQSPEGGNQVKVVVNYYTQDPMTENDLINGVMKVYSPNGTLLKTSSFPTPFEATASGKLQFLTTLTDSSIDSVTTNIVFTNPIKTETLSNELPVKINLNNATTPTIQNETQIETLEQQAISPQIPIEEETEQPKMIPPVPVEKGELTE